MAKAYRSAWDMWSRHANDPRGFFSWRLPAGPGADVLTVDEIERLKALPEAALVDLIRRTETAVEELTSLRRQLASRWVVERACPVCEGAVFGRPDKVYCSGRCRTRAYKARRI